MNLLPVCETLPCLNDAICRNQNDRYTCYCPSHWYGDMCEYTDINRTEVCIATFETLGRLYDLFVTHLSSFVLSKILILFE